MKLHVVEKALDLKINHLTDYSIWFNLIDRYLTASLKPHISRGDIVFVFEGLKFFWPSGF